MHDLQAPSSPASHRYLVMLISEMLAGCPRILRACYRSAEMTSTGSVEATVQAKAHDVI